MESQMKELDELKQNLAKVNEKFDKSKQNEAAKEREVKALKRRIAELEKELALEKVTAQMKAVLWSNIGRSIANQWQYIETMDEQMVLITKANREIQRARASLGHMPEAATRMINILNYKTSSQLAVMGITNRTETIAVAKRVVTLRNLVGTLERRTQDMQTEINRFLEKFVALQNRGLPSILSSVGRLLTLDNYNKRIDAQAGAEISRPPSTSADAGPATGQIMYDRVENLFFLMNEIEHLFDTPPNFFKFTEADETLGAILAHQLPTQEVWRNLTQTILSGQNQ